ncbi:glycosyltransferase family 2 protein [Candidatus Parcubacteria bacterium]|nr:glycosyltransferase family 2 protein [Candidatus Parcubacteria bacterium]
MNAFEIVVYPFLFAAIYFEVFLLVTLLSASKKKAPVPESLLPRVAVIVPCWNEESTISATTDSLLALSYPKDKLRIVLVNDGSTDRTGEMLESYASNPQVKVVHQENGGKFAAVNFGIQNAGGADLIGCLDADSFVEPNALREMIPYFDDATIAAVTPAMSVHKPKNILEHMQHAEFVLGIALRYILAVVNGLYVAPGPFSLYRRRVFDELGGFKYGYQTEDMEMALRVQKAGYAIASAPSARVYTKVMRTVPTLLKQRTRWTSGFLLNMIHDYWSLVGNPRYGALGLLVLPLAFFSIVGGLVVAGIALYHVIESIVRTVSVTYGVPLSYTLMPRFSLEWSSLPVTGILLLSLLAMLGSIFFIILGKRVSQTPGHLGCGVILYIFVYALVAPLWLARSVVEVTTGAKLSWRNTDARF